VVIARRALARGETIDAADAMPIYLRDKVAQTIAEREVVAAAKAARLAAEATAATAATAAATAVAPTPGSAT